MKILIVDDSRFNLEMISISCCNWGHSVVTAVDGAQAVECYRQERPDLVLMDVMMPVMNGFEATTLIRALAEPHWVPIILLTALDSDHDLVEGIESGADDYLTKPINFTVLREKVRVMERIAKIQGQLTESLTRLEDYRDKAEEERLLAARVMDRIVSFGQIDDPLVIRRVIPALNFSGDLVACARTPAGELHVALADATGHGLAAALNVLPITEIFYGMTAKGFPIPRIVAEMNRKLHLLMPRERFVAAVLVSIAMPRRTISVWNGGCPTALFVDETGKVLYSFPSVHPPLGILSEKDFNAVVETHPWPVSGQLLMCSDGLLEAENVEGIPFSLEGLARAIVGTVPRNRPDQIMETLRQHQGNAPQLDDISLVTVECHD
ncbi:two-component system, HptB-dependent secretion and biofilm response regulator [Gammaproteobacteria bacterium]